MMMYKMANKFVVLSVFLFCIKIALAAYDVEIKLDRYRRPKDCRCDRISDSSCHDCDVYFKVCLSGANCIKDDRMNHVINTHKLYFLDHPDKRNSYIFRLPNWKNTAVVTIEIFDYQKDGSDYSLGNISYSYTGPPVNKSVATTNTNVNIRFMFTIITTCVAEGNFVCNSNGTMNCQRDYYGPRCEIYCKSEGHKICTSRGTARCQPDYYGPNCTIHCVPTNKNQLCLSNGTRVCTETYFGPNCETYCEESVTVTCGIHGDKRCKSSENGTDLLCVNGTCKTPSHCACSPGFTGTHCDVKIDGCASSPCKNGVCMDGIQKYECICNPGFTGKQCETEIKESKSSPCVNGNYSDGPDIKFTCVCFDGFTGKLCETDIDECSNSPCIHGNCTDGENFYFCTCDAGFSGSNCDIDIDECLSSPCLHGSCQDDLNAFTCICNAGYTGKLCDVDIDECSSLPCRNGTCVNVLGNYTCECSDGFSGKTCEQNIYDCANKPCINGICFGGINVFECLCDSGFTGQICDIEVDECLSTPCINGTCLNALNGYSCLCDIGFTGKLCNTNIDECASSPCTHGYCDDGVNNFTCACHQGFTGSTCDVDIDECTSSPCVNGKCINLEIGYDCECNIGFSGENCEQNIDDCSDFPCVKGSCFDGDHAFYCTCDEGFTGEVCDSDINECESSPCLRGSCIDDVNSYSCICDVGYTGEQCDMDINDCAKSPCLHGKCTDEIDNFTCTCIPGYTGKRCEYKTIEGCSNALCNNGHCLRTLNNYSCLCYTGFTGYNCDINIDNCMSNSCMHGKCVDGNGTYECNCDAGFTGPLCNLKVDINTYKSRNSESVSTIDLSSISSQRPNYRTSQTPLLHSSGFDSTSSTFVAVSSFAQNTVFSSMLTSSQAFFTDEIFTFIPTMTPTRNPFLTHYIGMQSPYESDYSKSAETKSMSIVTSKSGHYEIHDSLTASFNVVVTTAMQQLQATSAYQTSMSTMQSLQTFLRPTSQIHMDPWNHSTLNILTVSPTKSSHTVKTALHTSLLGDSEIEDSATEMTHNIEMKSHTFTIDELKTKMVTPLTTNVIPRYAHTENVKTTAPTVKQVLIVKEDRDELTSTMIIVGNVRDQIGKIFIKIQQNLQRTFFVSGDGLVQVDFKSLELSTKPTQGTVTSIDYIVVCVKCKLEEDKVNRAVKSALQSLNLVEYSIATVNKDTKNVVVIVIAVCVFAAVTTCILVFFVIRKRRRIITRKSDKLYREKDDVINMGDICKEENVDESKDPMINILFDKVHSRTSRTSGIGISHV